MKATINGIVIEGEPKELAQFVDEWLNKPVRKDVVAKPTADELMRQWIEKQKSEQQSQGITYPNTYPWTTTYGSASLDSQQRQQIYFNGKPYWVYLQI